MAAAGHACGRLYESGLLDDATGGVMRPGGVALTARALGHCALRPGARVLDVGCGAGTSVEHLRRAFSLGGIGIDSSQAVLERGSRRNPDVPLVRGTGADLPFASGTVDGILMECSLSAMPDRERVLAECWRALVPAGRLAVSDLYARSAISPRDARAMSASCVAGMMTREDLARALEEQGFAIDLWEDHSPALTELMCRLVMEYGSLEPFWERQGLGSCESARVTEAVKRVHPGYFLLVARKERAGRRQDPSRIVMAGQGGSDER